MRKLTRTHKTKNDMWLIFSPLLFIYVYRLPLVNRFDINGERNTITYRHHLTTKRLIEKIRDHHGYAPSFPAGLFKTHSNQTMLIKFINNGKKPKADRVPCGQRITGNMPGIEGRLFCQGFANHVRNHIYI